MATSIRLSKIKKRYGKQIVTNIDEIFVDKGQIVCLLGPSGCGKTTVLRMIAGLVHQDEGDIYFGDSIINHLPPEQRHAAMVFQNYALFPHMTVYQNIAFGMMTRKKPKNEIDKKVCEVLELVQLPEMVDRFPKQLSGGQQQRIAVARALATEPELLLFDEPLSNLDAKLRLYMRFELRKLLEKLQITTVYVTHDQTEAMVIADRVILLDKGKVVQDDSPQNIYHLPKTRFVADFIGSAAFIEGIVEFYNTETGETTLKTSNGLNIHGIGKNLVTGGNAAACFRPENLMVLPEGSTAHFGVNTFEGKIEAATDFGELIEYSVKIGEWLLKAKALSQSVPFKAGQSVLVAIEPKRCVIIPD